jgi:tRNA(Arg) A34 adenosine deaminase TadA
MPKPLHTQLMNECLALARRAIDLGEVPIASVVARADGRIVGWGWNELKAKRDRTMHAEIAAFRDAAGRYPTDADDLVLASTLEPCIMCTGAAYLCGVRTIVYGLRAPADSGMDRIKPPSSPETQVPEVVGPTCSDEALALFEQWLRTHGESDDQAPYVRQLLSLHGRE